MASSPAHPVAASQDHARSLTLAGAGLIAVSFGLARYGYGLFAPQFQKDLHLSTAEIGLFSSLSYVGYGLGLVACPRIIRRGGARRAALSAAALVTVGILAIAVATAAGILATGVVIAGVGVGLSWPPFSELAHDHVDSARRPRVVSTISTGTSFGLIIAVPLALAAGSRWRAVWIAFAGLALLVLAVNVVCVPRGVKGPAQHPGRSGVVDPRSMSGLGAYSVIYGAIGATFFTFVVELARSTHHSHRASVLLWAIVGATGLAAIWTGEAINRLGLPNLTGLLLLGMATALLCIGLAPTHLLALDGAAALLGPFYMAGAAIVPRWSERIDPDSPARTHAQATGASALGSVAGAAAAGATAATAGLPATFTATAALALICSPIFRELAPTTPPV